MGVWFGALGGMGSGFAVEVHQLRGDEGLHSSVKPGGDRQRKWQVHRRSAPCSFSELGF